MNHLLSCLSLENLFQLIIFLVLVSGLPLCYLRIIDNSCSEKSSVDYISDICGRDASSINELISSKESSLNIPEDSNVLSLIVSNPKYQNSVAEHSLIELSDVK